MSSWILTQPEAFLTLGQVLLPALTVWFWHCFGAFWPCCCPTSAGWHCAVLPAGLLAARSGEKSVCFSLPFLGTLIPTRFCQFSNRKIAPACHEPHCVEWSAASSVLPMLCANATHVGAQSLTPLDPLPSLFGFRLELKGSGRTFSEIQTRELCYSTLKLPRPQVFWS